jgi:hypothetical protein
MAMGRRRVRRYVGKEGRNCIALFLLIRNEIKLNLVNQCMFLFRSLPLSICTGILQGVGKLVDEMVFLDPYFRKMGHILRMANFISQRMSGQEV